MAMSLTTIKVNYPRGFLDKVNQTGSGVRNNGFSKDQCAKWGVKEERPKLVDETSITLPLETLISTFNNIMNTYKLNPEKTLALHTISKLITTEESVVKHLLTKLNGTHGRCVILKNEKSIIFPTITYIPVLKETKQYLLILFIKFLKRKQEHKDNDKDKDKDNIMIMYEGHDLFTQLFAIIIDSFHFPNPEVQIKKDCTDTFSMITLLELVLNKKYKHILNLHLNSIPIPIPLPEVEVTLDNNNNDNNNNDNNNDNDNDDNDNDWDKEDFDININKIEDITTKDITITPEDITPKDRIDDNKMEDIPDDWDSI
jgi:hypothetical protein